MLMGRMPPKEKIGWIGPRHIDFLFEGELSSSRPVLLGFDFDGTLSPLVRRPDAARLPERTKRLLKRLSALPGVVVAIISGRGLKDISTRVPLLGVYHAGNHGLEICGPDFDWRHPRAGTAVRRVRGLARRIVAALKNFPGVLMENKRLTLSVHYRTLHPAREGELEGALKRSLESYDDLILVPGKKTWEIRPKGRWGKGQALLKIGRQAKTQGFVFFIGDDHTDEHGFRFLGERAASVRVGHFRGSSARFHLERQGEVHTLLKRLLKVLS